MDPIIPKTDQYVAESQHEPSSSMQPLSVSIDDGLVQRPARPQRQRTMPDIRGATRQARDKFQLTLAKAKTFADGLRKKPKKFEFRDLFPLIGSALQVPFLHFARGENDERMPPIILEALKVAIVDSDLPSDSPFTLTKFTIELEYGPHIWVIQRTINDFIRLHSQLSVRKLTHPRRLGEIPKFPNQIRYAFERAKEGLTSEADEHRVAGTRKSRRLALQSYLQKLVKSMSMKTHIEDLYEFLNLSSTSFRSGVKEKPKEQRLRLRGQKVYFSPCFPVSFTSETDIWAQVGSTYVAVFSAPFRLDPMALILFDNSCKVMTRKQRSRVKLKRHRTSVYSHFRNFEFEYHSEKDEIEWYQRIHSSIDQCSWSKLHRYQSFAPIRPHCLASWYVDASDYFEAVYNAILSAKDVIFLAGWWISPELYLRRPPPDHENSRLDRLLKKKAEEGVLIYVLLYKEVTLALPINSLYSKTRLRSLHPNMKVFRHPDARPLPIPWAHHEKLVVIDYTTAFIGGIDLCFGRYDSHNHPVMDSFPEIWPGQDYSNPRVADFRDVDEYHKELIDKRNTPRMGWHDISVCVQGSMDVAWHFIQRWNHCKMDKAPDKEIFPLIIPPDDLSKDVEKNGKSCTAQVLRSVGFWSSGSLTEPSIANAYLNLIENSERFLYIENQFFVTASGATNYVRNRIGEAIYQRIVKAYQKNQNFKVIILIPLLPAFENPVDAATAGTIRLVMNFQYESISRGTKSLLGRLKEVGIPHEKYIGFFSLRSFSPLMRTRSAVDIHKGANPNEVVDFVTEQTYVHSKLMIVDDRYVIVGSANLNDRSLLGDRDSEVGVVIEDNQKISIQTNGETIEVCEFAHSLRVRLFREHLGLLSSNVSPSWNQDGQELVNQLLNDPSSNEFFEKIWCDTADKNTAIFREVFSAVPDDTVTSWDEYYQFKNPNTHRTALNLPMDAISEKLSKIRGRLVRFPIRFLEKEALGASTFSRENLVPVDVFV